MEIFIKNHLYPTATMKIHLMPQTLSFGENIHIPLPSSTIISSGRDKPFIDAYFIDPKVWAFARAQAKSKGYDRVSMSHGNFYFSYSGNDVNDEYPKTVPCDQLRADMPPLPQYTKYLGIDCGAPNNDKLKETIDGLALKGLETIIRETGFVGPGRRTAVFGPGGVIIAMTDLYSVTIRY